jgi:GNAT superfamily N-acetyltransferase
MIALDNYIRYLASQYEQRRFGKTYVAVMPGFKTVAGYYSIVAGSIPFESMPDHLVRKLPRHPVPVVLIGRLAVAKGNQGCLLGEKLLLDAFRRAVILSGDLGIHAVLVEAIDDNAASFYRKYGFVELKDQPHRQIILISNIVSRRSIS